MRNSAIRKGKIRLLAGIMASLLLSTACLSGVRAAGTEDHMTLHASDGGWKATAEAGETPFPEGAALHIAAGDDTTVAEVRKSIESMDQEESALKSLNVYEISLSDGDGKLLDYDDEITLTVTDENAVQQDSDDEISCVVYPITEDGESENGLSVGEPVTADAVKLSDAGDLAEFTVKTSLTGKIAAAVYTVSDDETEEQKDEINTLVLDDGETGGNENSDIGISTFAVNPDGEGKITLPELKEIKKEEYSPLNNLQIVDNIEGAKVEVIARENGNGVFHWNTIKDGEGLDKIPNDSMYVGEFYGISGSGWAEYGIDKYIYDSMQGDENDEKFGAVSVQFKSSVEGYRYDVDLEDGSITYKETDDPVLDGDGNPCNIYKNPPEDYRRKYRIGWNEKDLDLDATTMKVTLRYTNAGYYKGELIDAKAVISITPSKNKNRTSNNDPLNEGGYCGIYYPMFQASGSLYRGWVWQNVEQFHVELTFYEKGSDTPIALGSSNASSTEENQSIDAMNADYYVINSLNPESQIETNEKPTVYVGPEYVLPTHDIANAYKVGTYTGSEGTSYSSNIQEQYDDDSEQPIQYAYNGGTTEWLAENDEPGEDGWAQNSVMIMPEAGTKTLGFTLGNMSRIPPSGDATATQATNLMWASISTTPYTKEYQPINIDVEKTWQGITDLTDIQSIDLELYGEYVDDDGKTVELDLDRQITITKEGNWKGTFNFVPGKDFLTANNYNTDFRYVVRETEITYTDGDSKTPEKAGFKLGGTTAIWLKSVGEDGGTIKQKFALTNIMPGLTIIKNGIDSDGKEKPLKGVEFQLQKAGDDWQPIAGETARGASTGTEGKLVFSDLAEGNYLLTETKTLPGYTLLKEPVKITIPYTVEASPDTGTSYVASDDVIGVTDGNKTKYYNLTYTITNGQSFDLPQTGGTTTGRFMRCGAVLSVTAAGVLLCQRAGRRRWREKS